ncbi:MAG TPA: hypothetical protein EYG69_03475 [Campylobacterales bacterium]|nr:hypothetical protein [Campylobacterales bacterium]
MNKYLEQLIQLQKIDIEIDSFEPRIAKARATLDGILEQQESVSKNIEATTEAITDAELKKRKNELHLEELNEKLKEISSKGDEVKTEKEIKALQLEEDIAKEQVDFANEEIERFDRLKESKEGEIVELNAKLEELKEQSIAIEIETSQKLEEIEKDRLKVFTNKEKLLSQMTQNIIIFYEKVRRWAKNTTVVAVKKQACYGCYMRLNDHTYAEIVRGEEITTCTHCGRILYKEVEEEKEDDSTKEA